jgi:hypothetical protein
MPKEGNAEYSENTRLKQDHLWLIFNTLGGVLSGILKRHQEWVNPQILYGDLNGGPGWYPTLSREGSPLLALRMATKHHLPMQAVIWESDGDTCGKLCQNLVQYGRLRLINDNPQTPMLRSNPLQAIHFDLLQSSHVDSVPQYLQKIRQTAKTRYGLFYSDENGSMPPFHLLQQCAEMLPLCDIVIHMAATPLKRQFYSPRHDLNQRISTLLQMIRKDFWIVRKPYGPLQWTFLIGTNWKSFPKFQRHGFYGVEEISGRDIMRRLDYNETEYIGQFDLFAPE